MSRHCGNTSPPTYVTVTRAPLFAPFQSSDLGGGTRSLLSPQGSVRAGDGTPPVTSETTPAVAPRNWSFVALGEMGGAFGLPSPPERVGPGAAGGAEVRVGTWCISFRGDSMAALCRGNPPARAAPPFVPRRRCLYAPPTALHPPGPPRPDYPAPARPLRAPYRPAAASLYGPPSTLHPPDLSAPPSTLRPPGPARPRPPNTRQVPTLPRRPCTLKAPAHPSGPSPQILNLGGREVRYVGASRLRTLLRTGTTFPGTVRTVPSFRNPVLYNHLRTFCYTPCPSPVAYH